MNKSLTPREQQILSLIAEGQTNRVISERLGISVRTVEGHRARLMLKLHFQGVADAVKYAIRSGLIKP
jgi:two-component system, NarL family, response regulator NreC